MFVAQKWFSAEEVLSGSFSEKTPLLSYFIRGAIRKPRKNLCKCDHFLSKTTQKMSSFAPLAPELAEPDRRQRRMKRSCDDATYEPSTHLLFSYSFRCPRDIARSLPRILVRDPSFFKGAIWPNALKTRVHGLRVFLNR